MKQTYDLIKEFLIFKIGDKLDLSIGDYELNGSKLIIKYYYNPQYEWNLKYISYDNKDDFELLDYITFLHTNK